MIYYHDDYHHYESVENNINDVKDDIEKRKNRLLVNEENYLNGKAKLILQLKQLPLLSVLEAIRSSEGSIKVIGRIVGRSTNLKVISRTEWNCGNIECKNVNGSVYHDPVRIYPLPHLDNTSGTAPTCFVCKTRGSLKIKYEYKNANIIQLDDIDTIEEKFDRLGVILYDEVSNNITDGEIVEIEGKIFTQRGMGNRGGGGSRFNNSNKLVNILYSDKTIIYKHKKEIKVTQKDVDNFYKWKQISNNAYKKELEVVNKYKNIKKEERPDWIKKINPMTFEQRVTGMFAPNVYGHADKKLGILRSIVGGSTIENGAENGRRGRLHTLLIGDPGTAKTALSTESIKVNPNSRMVDATGASGKSLVGIVDKENDSLMVKYGVVVAAKNSHVVINEGGSMSHEDQWHLVGIAEEGKTSLDKWGEHIPIDAPTTLIITANPLGTKWESTKISKDKMIVIRQNLLDRIDQIYGFFDTQTEEEMEGFIEELDKITDRKPHNYNFLSKFLQYAKTIDPKLTVTTRYRLNKFWIKAKLKGMAGNRSFFSIKRIAEAQAKLNLSWEVDDIIAIKTMESLRLMYNQYGTTIEQIQDPRDLTVKIFYSILKENEGLNHSVRELCKKASEKSKQVNGYLKKRWDFENNKELKTIVNMLEQYENIKTVGLKPRILVYYSPSSVKSENDKTITTTFTTSSLSGVSDLSAQHSSEIIKKNNENNDNQQLNSLADTPDRPASKEEESLTKVTLVNISDNRKGQPIEMTREQFNSWEENEKDSAQDESR